MAPINNPPAPAEDSSQDSEGGAGFAASRAELYKEPEEKSKFERHGRKYFEIPLETELHKMKKNKKIETRLERYQIEAVLAVRDHFRGISSGAEVELDGTTSTPNIQKALIIAPPGSGKSGMVTLIPYVLQSKKVLILTPSKIISEQLAEDFGHPDIDRSTPFFRKCGMYKENRELNTVLEEVHLALTQTDIDKIPTKNLVIINAQKFGGRSASSLSTASGLTEERREQTMRKLQKFDTIIVDEAHHYPAQTWVNILEAFEGKRVIFLTATPFRGDEHIAETLENNVKTVYEIDHQSLQGKTIRPTEFIERPAESEDLEDSSFLEQLKLNIEELLSKHNAQEPRPPPNHASAFHQAMILVRTKKEAQDVATALGSDATFVISGKEWENNVVEFTEGRKRIAVVCGMLKEGYDNPNVSLVVILRKCQSRVLFEQFCGRCMRVNRSLTGKEVDKTVGTVLSYTHFNQSVMWAKRNEQAVDDPVDVGEDDDRVANVI